MRSVKEIAHMMRDQGKSKAAQTLVEVVGIGRVLIENHCGILAYGSEMISVGATFGTVEISGSGLRLCCMNREQLFVSGQILSITLERGIN